MYRNTTNSSGTATKIADIAVGTTLHDDTTALVEDGNRNPLTYWYWVKSKNLVGSSDFSQGDTGTRGRIADIAGANPGTTVTSAPVTINGVAGAPAISITGGQYAVSTDGGSTWSAFSATTPSTVTNGDQIQLTAAASTSLATTMNVQVSIGGVTDTWTVTTLDPNPAWLFTLELTNADKVNLQFGMAPGATDGYDDAYDMDSPEAPVPASNLGGAYFVDAAEFLYQKDVRASNTVAVWLLEVVTNQQSMVLSWAGGQAPAGRYLQIYQASNYVAGQKVAGTQKDLNTSGSISVPAKSLVWFVIESQFVAPPFSLTLQPGWNLFALPIEPENPAAAAIFEISRGAIEGDNSPADDSSLRDGRRGSVTAGSAWSWIGGKSGHYETVTELHALTGYWVCASGQTAATITVRGCYVPERFVLQQSWNLLGVPGELVLPTWPAVQGHLWWWDAANLQYQFLEPGGKAVPGLGYWGFGKEPAVLDLSPR